MSAARRILAIDGGGIKGVIPAAFLAAVENATGKRIVDYFDLIAGTSTGGIIAIGLGMGMSAQTILDFYLQNGASVFGREAGAGWWANAAARFLRRVRWVFRPKYRSRKLEGALREVFGDSRLGDSQTRLLIPAVDAQRRDLHVFKTAHHERFKMDWREGAVEVALATSAAPTYFPDASRRVGLAWWTAAFGRTTPSAWPWWKLSACSSGRWNTCTC